jgi:hypothetical protein
VCNTHCTRGLYPLKMELRHRGYLLANILRIQKQRRMDGWRKCPQWIPVRKSTRQREWVFFYLYEDGVAWNHLYLGVYSLNFLPFLFKHEYK